MSSASISQARSGTRKFLEHLGIQITPTCLSELIIKTRKEHREDNFSLDANLQRFGKLQPQTHSKWGSYVKQVFKTNACPLTATMPEQKAKKTKRISAGILKTVYDSLPRDELRLICDLLAFVPERLMAVCAYTPISAWEDFNDKYTIIRFDSEACKVAYDHIGILPKPLADKIREYTKQTGRYPGPPFPNASTLWREITKFTLEKFGIRLTSSYLRKEYTAKAKKTPMPPNDWDFLAGHKQKIGHQAHHYDPEDDPDLIREYDRYLAPYLGLWNTRDPDETKDPFKTSPELEQLRKENLELKEQILKLTKLLTERLQTP
ncbi:MAG: hypothetical protein JRN21_04010 [Nitrososphaerota archaeon]|nr:hypothetical protein [Nitrososphaerota archaeon]